MPIFNDGERFHPLNISSFAASPGVGPATDPSATFMGGFAEVDNQAGPAAAVDYPPNIVAGFAPAVDYLDEIAYAGFPSTHRAAYSVAKRAFDVAFAALALIGVAPLFAIIAIAIKLSSPGPVFFRQERVGKDGCLFKMLKFRTMRVADESFTDTAWRANDDPRRTPIGHVLRRTSLDELPQFINVIKGDMSVVGPRPERPFFVEKFSGEIPHYNLRHTGAVGITGWAQVHGYRGDTCIQTRVKFDLEYLEQWTLGLDLKIIWLTVKRVFTSDHE
jgi:exopolysaccharide biosynthesis polyprenyl glycosylphosphotransferase